MSSKVDWKEAFHSRDAYCNDLQRAHVADEQKIKDILQENKDLKQTIKDFEKTIARLQSTIQEKDDELAESRLLIAELEARNVRGVKALGRDWDVQPEAEISTWLEDLQEANFSRDALKDAYRKACRANNQSSVIFSPYCLKYEAPALDDAGEPIEFSEADLLVCNPAAHFKRSKRSKFDFARLLGEVPRVMAKIVEYTMRKDGPLHIVFRLDKHDEYPPRQGGLDPESGLAFRFFWGDGACAVNSAPLPCVVLAPLLVNRTWLEIFGTCFYGTNIFSFQSLGEFNLFFKRLAPTRRQRVQHIELWWIGSAMPKGKNGYERTWALRHFVNLRRLKTLKIYLNESKWLRRPNEPEHVKAVLQRFTKNHANNCMHRDLRAIRGKDYVYQLRGVESVQIFDFEAAKDRTLVRDDTFITDMRVQIMQAKSYGAAKKIRVEKLDSICPVLRGWVPTQQVMALVKNFMDNIPIPTSHDAARPTIAPGRKERFKDVRVRQSRGNWPSGSIDEDTGGNVDGKCSGSGTESRKRQREAFEFDELKQSPPLSLDGGDESVTIKKSSSSSLKGDISDDDVQFIREELFVVDLTDDTSIKDEAIGLTMRADFTEEEVKTEGSSSGEMVLQTIENSESPEIMQSPHSSRPSRFSRSLSTLFVQQDSPDLYFPLGDGKVDNERPRRVLEAQLAHMSKRARLSPTQ